MRIMRPFKALQIGVLFILCMVVFNSKAQFSHAFSPTFLSRVQAAGHQKVTRVQNDFVSERVEWHGPDSLHHYKYNILGEADSLFVKRTDGTVVGEYVLKEDGTIGSGIRWIRNDDEMVKVASDITGKVSYVPGYDPKTVFYTHDLVNQVWSQEVYQEGKLYYKETWKPHGVGFESTFVAQLFNGDTVAYYHTNALGYYETFWLRSTIVKAAGTLSGYANPYIYRVENGVVRDWKHAERGDLTQDFLQHARIDSEGRWAGTYKTSITRSRDTTRISDFQVIRNQDEMVGIKSLYWNQQGSTTFQLHLTENNQINVVETKDGEILSASEWDAETLLMQSYMFEANRLGTLNISWEELEENSTEMAIEGPKHLHPFRTIRKQEGSTTTYDFYAGDMLLLWQEQTDDPAGGWSQLSLRSASGFELGYASKESERGIKHNLSFGEYYPEQRWELEYNDRGDWVSFRFNGEVHFTTEYIYQGDLPLQADTKTITGDLVYHTTWEYE